MLKRNRIRFITVVKTYIHHSIAEAKEQSIQWVFRDESPQRRLRRVYRLRKSWLNCFGIYATRLSSITLEKAKIINEEYYINLLNTFIRAPHLEKKKSSSITIMQACTIACSFWQISWFKIRIASASSTISTWFNPQQLFSIYKYKNMALRENIGFNV